MIASDAKILVCKKCRLPLPDGSVFCMYCGANQEGTRKKASRIKSRREKGSGGVSKLSGNRRNPWRAYAPRKAGSPAALIGTFATRFDAENALCEHISRHNTSSMSDWTLEMFYEHWITTDEYKKLSDGAQHSHMNAWKYFVSIKKMRMRDIKTSHLQLVIDAAADLGRKRAVCEKIKNLASLLCQEAMRDDVMNKNYAVLLRLPASDYTHKDVFTDAEIDILKSHDDDRRAKLILILIYSGMRVGELLMVENANINLEVGYVISGEKTEAGRNRLIPLVDPIKEYVEQLTSDGKYFVHMDDGRKMRREYFEKRIFKAYLVELGILDEPKEGQPWRLSPHSTRHTFATKARKAGIKEDVIERVIGHTEYTTTDKYYVTFDAAYLVDQMRAIGQQANSR